MIYRARLWIERGDGPIVSDQRILIVDDQKFVRHAVRTMLESRGNHQVIEAENGHEALLLLGAHLPNLIICDIGMKPIDGFSFLSMLQTGTHGFFDVPFIFLTGNGDAEAVKKAADMKVDGYLLKPVKADRLIDAVAKAVKKHGGDGDLSRMKVLVVDDDPVVRKVVTSVLTDHGCQTIFQAADGDAALAMMRAALPTMVISDIEMSPLDGFCFLRELRSSCHRLFDFPVIFLTSYPDPLNAMKADQLGVNGFLAKPVNAETLHATIDQVISKRSMEG